MFAGLKELTDSFLSKGVPGFDCILMKDGKQIFRNMGGFRDPEKTQPIDETERYNVYSATKMITCTAALQLWEKGAFSLEDPLVDRENGVTFFYARHIMGLNNNYFNDAMVAELKKLIPQLM